jgi:hypothetical protein
MSIPKGKLLKKRKFSKLKELTKSESEDEEWQPLRPLPPIKKQFLKATRTINRTTPTPFTTKIKERAQRTQTRSSAKGKFDWKICKEPFKDALIDVLKLKRCSEETFDKFESLDPTIELLKEFLYDSRLGVHWSQHLSLPLIRIALNHNHHNTSDEYAGFFVRMTAVVVTKNGKTGPVCIVDTGLKGDYELPITKSGNSFKDIWFNSNSKTYQKTKFQLIISYVSKSHEPNQLDELIDSYISPPLFVCSKGSAGVAINEKKKFIVKNYFEAFMPEELDKPLSKSELLMRNIIEEDSNALYRYLRTVDCKHKVKHLLFLLIKFPMCLKLYYNPEKMTNILDVPKPIEEIVVFKLLSTIFSIQSSYQANPHPQKKTLKEKKTFKDKSFVITIDYQSADNLKGFKKTMEGYTELMEAPTILLTSDSCSVPILFENISANSLENNYKKLFPPKPLGLKAPPNMFSIASAKSETDTNSTSNKDGFPKNDTGTSNQAKQANKSSAFSLTPLPTEKTQDEPLFEIKSEYSETQELEAVPNYPNIITIDAEPEARSGELINKGPQPQPQENLTLQSSNPIQIPPSIPVVNDVTMPKTLPLWPPLLHPFQQMAQHNPQYFMGQYNYGAPPYMNPYMPGMGVSPLSMPSMGFPPLGMPLTGFPSLDTPPPFGVPPTENSSTLPLGFPSTGTSTPGSLPLAGMPFGPLSMLYNGLNMESGLIDLEGTNSSESRVSDPEKMKSIIEAATKSAEQQAMYSEMMAAMSYQESLRRMHEARLMKQVTVMMGKMQEQVNSLKRT